MRRGVRRLGITAGALLVLALLGRLWLLPAMGRLLVDDQPPPRADLVVVLATGAEYYPRLIEAARLVSTGTAPRILIDGDRKTPALRRLETQGFRRAAPWDEDALRILELLGVARSKVARVSAEDAYDTISEALALGPELARLGVRRILLVTSRFHTRRAAAIWRRLYGDRLEITPVAAREDPFDPDGWWHDGRQIRWLMAEYGGWIFYGWQALTGRLHSPGDRLQNPGSSAVGGV